MSSLNKPLSKQFKEEYEIIEKGLATKEEINRLKKHSNHKEWLAKWWIPINWCCDMVRAQCSKEGREYCQRHYQIQNTVRINHSVCSNSFTCNLYSGCLWHMLFLFGTWSFCCSTM